LDFLYKSPVDDRLGCGYGLRGGVMRGYVHFAGMGIVLFTFMKLFWHAELDNAVIEKEV